MSYVFEDQSIDPREEVAVNVIGLKRPDPTKGEYLVSERGEIPTKEPSFVYFLALFGVKVPDKYLSDFAATIDTYPCVLPQH